MTNRFVFTDLHGNGEIWEQIKRFIGNQPAVFLGDAADRGPDGFRIICEMKDMPNLTYLRGNHEELLIKATREYMRDGFPNDQAYLLSYNGGFSTFQAWEDAGRPMDIINWLDKLPIALSDGNYDMCHSGCLRTPLYEDWAKQDLWELTWHRSHFAEPWYEGRTLIHGHTPVRHLTGYRNFDHKAVLYNNKLDLDVETAACGVSAVYDLENKKVFYIDKNGVQSIEDPVRKQSYGKML